MDMPKCKQIRDHYRRFGSGKRFKLYAEGFETRADAREFLKITGAFKKQYRLVQESDKTWSIYLGNWKQRGY